MDTQKKGQILKDWPLTVKSAPHSAQAAYRQQAKRFRQQAAKSQQHSLAAKARAEADIKIAPAESLKNVVFIVVSKKLNKILRSKTEMINLAGSRLGKRDRRESGRRLNEGTALFDGSLIRGAEQRLLLGRCRIGTSACWRNLACPDTKFHNSRPASAIRSRAHCC